MKPAYPQAITTKREYECYAGQEKDSADPRKTKADAPQLVATLSEELRAEQIPAITPESSRRGVRDAVTLGAATEKGAGDHEEHCDNEASVDKEAGHLTDTTPPRPNGSRLSCGASAGGRKCFALRYEAVGGTNGRFL